MKKVLAMLAVGIMIFPLVTLAQTQPPAAQNVSISNYSDVVGIVNKVINWMQALLFLLATIFILYAAFLYLTSGGDETKTKKAKDIIIYAVIALAIALIAQGVGALVKSFLGVTT